MTTRPSTCSQGDTLDGVQMLLIADPQKDLTTDELTQIKTFAEAGENLFVLRDYTDPVDLDYLSLLKNYGVVPIEGVVVAGEEDQGNYYGSASIFCRILTRWK